MNLAQKLWCQMTQSRRDPIFQFLIKGGDRGVIDFSTEQLIQSATQVAHSLAALPNKSKMVVVIMQPGPEFLQVLLGCIFAGKICIPSPSPRFGLHAHRIKQIKAQCPDSTVICTTENWPQVQNALEQGTVTEYGSMISFPELVDHDHIKEEVNSLDGWTLGLDEPVIIQFTSGSTSKSKGVLISGRNTLANQAQVAVRWNFSPEKVLLSWLPHFHDMGLFGGLLFPLLSGQKLVQMDPLHFIQKPVRWLAAIDRYQVNFSGGPAFAFELCNDHIEDEVIRELDLSSWEIAFCGADFVPAKTLQRFREKFSAARLNPGAVVPVYGLAEATLFVAGEPNPNGALPTVEQSNQTEGCYLGQSYADRLEVRDSKTGALCGEGREGQIWIKGESVSLGYLDELAKTTNLKEHLINKLKTIIFTGDIGIIRYDYLFVKSREKDIIIYHGKNHSPAEIEQIAAEVCDWLNPHGAAAFQTGPLANTLVLLIELKPGIKWDELSHGSTKKEIIQKVFKKIGLRLNHVLILKRGTLKRTSSGKIMRNVVARKYTKEFFAQHPENN